MEKIIDTHAHITMREDQDEVDIVKKALENGVCKIINICTSIEALERGFLLEEKFKNIVYNAAAITPHDASELAIKNELHKIDEFLDFIQKYAEEKKLIAIGETGLDYYYYIANKDIQKKCFIKQIELAKKYALPLIIHARDSFDDIFDILQSERFDNAILHCFTGNILEFEKALQFVKYISFSGIITFKNATDLREVVKKCPLDRMLIETDSPYLAPGKFRGKINQPAYINEVVIEIANIKGLSKEKVIENTTQNAIDFFQL